MDKEPVELKDTCATCEFSFVVDKQRFCRRFPPVEMQTMIPRNQLTVPQQLQLGKDQQFVSAVMSRFPSVQDTWTCGEHSENFEEETPEDDGKPN